MNMELFERGKMYGLYEAEVIAFKHALKEHDEMSSVEIKRFNSYIQKLDDRANELK